MEQTAFQQPKTIIGDCQETAEQIDIFNRNVKSVWDIRRNLCAISVQYITPEHSKLEIEPGSQCQRHFMH